MSGGTEKRIIKPGYHIRPKYDLHGFRERQSGDHKGHIAGELPLTPMIDMFSVLVIFLLMNFSSTGEIFYMSKAGITLPEAATSAQLASAPLISFVKGVYYLDAQTPSGKLISFEDRSENLQGIVQKLEALKKEMQAAGTKAFKGQLNFQADENTPLLFVKRGMGAATSAGFSAINFVVKAD
jgi:biopolymer transport protein ExbD